jgi:hypothetical protein
VEVNEALADWCRAGGSLVFVGGTDAYNAVPDSWWQQEGYAAPGEDLFARLGLPITGAAVLHPTQEDINLEAVAGMDGRAPTELTIPMGVPVVFDSQLETGTIIYPGERAARSYAITQYALPPTGIPLYYLQGEASPAVWEAPVGAGTAIYVGVAPGFLAATPQGSQWVRFLARYALEKAGGAYREQAYFLARRGPYTAVKALTEAYTLRGRFVDLFSPTLSLVQDPLVPPGECAFLHDAHSRTVDEPGILTAAGRLRACHEQPEVTSFIVQAPAGTNGAARLWTGDRTLKSLAARTVYGEQVEITYVVEEDTVLLQYPNDADGLVVKVVWEAA